MSPPTDSFRNVSAKVRLERISEVGFERFRAIIEKLERSMCERMQGLESMRLWQDELIFSMKGSAKGGVDIKIGSCTVHAPEYLSVRHPLLQMVLFARERYGNTFGCLKSMAPKTIVDMSETSDLSDSPTECVASWISPYLPGLSFNPSVSEKTSSTISATPQSGDNGLVLKPGHCHSATTDAKLTSGVNNHNMFKLSKAAGADYQLLQQSTLTSGNHVSKLPVSMALDAACTATANMEKMPTIIGSVDCGKGASSVVLTPTASLHGESIVNNPRDEHSNNPCSIGAPAITSSAETHIPIAYELPGTEFQLHRNSGSGRFILRPMESPVNRITKASMDVIYSVVKSSVTICTKGGIYMKNTGLHTIHVRQYFSGIFSRSKADHLRATHIYMMANGTVQHSANMAIPKKRRSDIDEEIIFDSGSEDHITGNFALLSRVTAVERGRGVVSASGHFMAAKCSGSLVIDGIKLNDVLFVPKVTGTIISVSKLDDLGYSIEVIRRRFLVRDIRTGDLVGEGHRSRGMYEVEHLEIPLDRARAVA